MTNLLEMKNITKVYKNGVTANRNVSFSVKKGEIHALMGENGAGKSTLMKVLFGLETPDEGEIFFDGKQVNITDPSKAIELGIGMVNQHFMLVDSLTVYENVFLGMIPRKGLFTDNKFIISQVKKYSDRFNFKITAEMKVEDISVSMKQKVEILKVLLRGSKLIILDEPTAVLTPQETDELFEQFLLLKEDGYTIIFISHKINEVMHICDRVTVLRSGRNIDTVNVEQVTSEQISKLMVGRDVILDIEKTDAEFKEPILEVNNLITYDSSGVKVLDDVTFQVKGGQILGVAGVDGNGQNELAETIFGIRESASGVIKIEKNDITNNSIAEVRSHSVSLIPEDRMTFGVAGDMTIWENLISDKVDKEQFKNRLGLDLPQIKEYSNNLREQYRIKSMNVDQSIDMLSGGNIQKVVIARELSASPRLLIANQPTRGVDVGAQELIWNELVKYRDQANAVLLISADLNEILELSDSIMVMIDGKIVAYIEDSKNLSEEELGLYMLGVKTQDEIVGGTFNE